MLTSVDFMWGRMEHAESYLAYRRYSKNYFLFALPIDSLSMAAFPRRSPHLNYRSKEYYLSAYFLNSLQGWQVASTIPEEEKKVLALDTVDVLGH